MFSYIILVLTIQHYLDDLLVNGSIYCCWQLSKDIYDENEDISYSWVREYNWDVCSNLLYIENLIYCKYYQKIFTYRCLQTGKGG